MASVRWIVTFSCCRRSVWRLSAANSASNAPTAVMSAEISGALTFSTCTSPIGFEKLASTITFAAGTPRVSLRTSSYCRGEEEVEGEKWEQREVWEVWEWWE